MLLPFKFSSRIKSDLSTTITVLYDSMFVYVFIITRELYIFVCFCVMANILSTWTPFSSSCKAALVLMNSLSFCLSGNFVYQEKNYFLKLVWPDTVFLVDSFFLSAFWMFHPTPFFPVTFLLIYLLIIIWKFLCMWQVSFLSLHPVFRAFDFW